jgi:hypothetical protein
MLSELGQDRIPGGKKGMEVGSGQHESELRIVEAVAVRVIAGPNGNKAEYVWRAVRKQSL